MKNIIKDEHGEYLLVEAAIVYPIMLIMIMTLLLISMLLTMKANMQSALETSLIYYKNELTDTYVEFFEKESSYLTAGTDGKKIQYTGLKAPAVPNGRSGWSNIYTQCFEEMFKKPDKEKFEEIFFNNYKFLNFSSGKKGGTFNSTGIEITLNDTGNFVVYRCLSAAAEQTVTLPFVNGFFGIDNKVKLKAEAEVFAVDSVTLMRTTDIVDYSLHKTKLDEKIDKLYEKYITPFLDFLKAK